jgi:TonB family protein
MKASAMQIAFGSALLLHAGLLAVSVGPERLPVEPPRRIAIRLAEPAPRPQPSPPAAAPRPEPPRRATEKENQNHSPAPPHVRPAPAPGAAEIEPPPPPAAPEAAAAQLAAPQAVAASAADAGVPVPEPTTVEAPVSGKPSPPSARLADYLALVRAAVENNRTYPPVARQLGLQGTVLLRLVIDRDGTIERITLVHSSGHKSLDKAAQAAARAGGPFRKPADFGLNGTTLDIPITYILN